MVPVFRVGGLVLQVLDYGFTITKMAAYMKVSLGGGELGPTLIDDVLIAIRG